MLESQNWSLGGKPREVAQNKNNVSSSPSSSDLRVDSGGDIKLPAGAATSIPCKQPDNILKLYVR